jgi:hypothetical protein
VDGSIVIAEERNVVEAFDRVDVFAIPSLGTTVPNLLGLRGFE